MKRKARGLRKSVRFESLERRELFATDVAAALSVAPETGSALAAERLSVYVSNQLWKAYQPQEVQHFDSREQFDDQLNALVTKYWQGVWGKPVSQVSEPFWSNRLIVDSVGLGASEGERFGAPLAVSQADTMAVRVAVGSIGSDLTAETDDGYLYTSSNWGLAAVDIRDPAHMSSTVTGEYRQNARLLVSGDRLIVVSGSVASTDIYQTVNKIWSNQAKVEIFDIADRMAPRLIDTWQFDGDVESLQSQDGHLTLVTKSSSGFVLPPLRTVTGSDGIEHFENADTYIARNQAQLLSAMLPDYSHVTEGAGTHDLGSWTDVTFASDALMNRISIIQMDISSAKPTLLGAEHISGISEVSAYTSGDTLIVYAVTPYEVLQASTTSSGSATSLPDSPGLGVQTRLFKVDLNLDSASPGDSSAAPNGDPELISGVSVPIQILNDLWLSESDGVLRVAGRGANRTGFFTIGDLDGQWQVLGSISDLAPGQSLLSAYFDGDHAVVTTGQIESLIATSDDPLHGIDLSDPAHPKELSALTIPGNTLHLLKVDDSHLLGIGFQKADDSIGARQLVISLYDISQLSDPQVVNTWTSPEVSFSFRNDVDAQAVTYDAATGLLLIGSTVAWTNRPTAQLPPIFKIDLDAADPLVALDSMATQYEFNFAQRLLLAGDYVLSVGEQFVLSRHINDLTTALDQAFLTKPAGLLLDRTYSSGSSDVVMLVPDWNPPTHSVVSIETPDWLTANFTSAGTLNVAVSQDAPSTTGEIVFKYMVGEKVTAIRINVVNYNVNSHPTSNTHAKILARFEDNNGQTITNLKSGDEAWVVLTAQDMRANGTGIFAAYFNVSFESDNVEVIGQAEHLGQYKNGKQAVTKSDGFSVIGGFGDSVVDEAEPQDVVRFRVRITSAAPVALSIVPADGQGNEFLVYSESLALKNSNVETARLTAQATGQPAEGEVQHDINGDGYVSGLDVLQIINFINNRPVAPLGVSAESSSLSQISLYDLTGDGDVTAVDVLQIVNSINARDLAFGEWDSATQKRNRKL